MSEVERNNKSHGGVYSHPPPEVVPSSLSHEDKEKLEKPTTQLGLALPPPADIHSLARDGNNSELGNELEIRPERLNEKDKDGKTVLMLAAYKGHKGTVMMLLDVIKKKGIWVALNEKNNIGNTATICACIQQNVDIAEMLTKAGADIYIKNNNGQNAMYFLKTEADKKKIRGSRPSLFASCFCQ